MQNKFACLTYHAIGEGSNQYELGDRQLRTQLAFLHDENYTVEGFEELEGRLQSAQAFPARYVVLTVDDGRQSAMVFADTLEEHSFRGTFFLTRDWCMKRSGFIRRADIRELRRRGFSVGTHGSTHRALTFLPRERCVAELSESHQWLEDALGEQVRYMAAPGGFVNRNVLNLAYEVGYSLVGTCEERVNSASTLKLPGTVNRVNVRRHFSLHDFRRIVESDPGFYLRRRLRSALLWLPKRVLSR